MRPGVTHRLIRGYLVAHGFRATLAQFDAASGRGGGGSGIGGDVGAESDADMDTLRDNADIRERFLDGDVEGVRTLLKVRYCFQVISVMYIFSFMSMLLCTAVLIVSGANASEYGAFVV